MLLSKNVKKIIYACSFKLDVNGNLSTKNYISIMFEVQQHYSYERNVKWRRWIKIQDIDKVNKQNGQIFKKSK